MSQYAFSFVRSEYDRIPYVLKQELASVIETSKADPGTKALVEEVSSKMVKVVEDIRKYAQDQLVVR